MHPAVLEFFLHHLVTGDQKADAWITVVGPSRQTVGYILARSGHPPNVLLAYTGKEP